jgi:hypothetical protein
LLGFSIYHFSIILAVFFNAGWVGVKPNGVQSSNKHLGLQNKCFKGFLTNLAGKLKNQIKGSNNTPLQCQHLKLHLLLT